METADVLIVGGGLVGCATAWHLACAGLSVLLLEAGEINNGASGQNAGSLHFQIERRFLENGDALAEQATRVVALNRLAVAEWRGLEAALGRDLEVAMDGGLMVAETPDQARMLEAKAAREAQFGLGTRVVDGAEARRIAPYLSPAIVAASYLADEGHANPRLITPAFAAAATEAGARLYRRTRVTALARARGGGFRAEATGPEGRVEVRADRLLVAAGAWTARIGALINLHLPIFPVALTMNVTERAQPFMPHLVQHVGRRLSMKQAHDGNVLIGGGWPSRLARSAEGDFRLDARPLLVDANLRENLRAAVDTVPAVRQLNLIRSWTGTVAITADQLPLIGEVPRIPGFFVAAGGSAFTLGPTFARLLAGLIAGRGDIGDELAIFSPARFEHLNSFMG